MSEPVLKDQVTLIVGGGRNPGPALAQAFAANGAIVGLNDLSPVPLDPVVDRIEAVNGRARAYVADATRGMPLRAMLDDVLSDWGRIDILINNPRIRPEKALIEMDEWDWQRTVEMNLNGPFLVSQLVARLMREQGGGVILNIIDTNPAELEARGQAAYAASQAGLLAFSQAAAREFLAYNIRVHTLCPQPAFLLPKDTLPEEAEALTRQAVYLASPAAAQLAGQVFRLGDREQE